MALGEIHIPGLPLLIMPKDGQIGIINARQRDGPKTQSDRQEVGWIELMIHPKNNPVVVLQIGEGASPVGGKIAGWAVIGKKKSKVLNSQGDWIEPIGRDLIAGERALRERIHN